MSVPRRDFTGRNTVKVPSYDSEDLEYFHFQIPMSILHIPALSYPPLPAVLN
jgi:hypothetical protein